MGAATAPTYKTRTMLDLIETLKSLVRLDSRTTHPIDWPGPSEANEEQVAAFIRPILEEMGFAVEIQYAAPHRPNMIAFHGKGGRPAFGLTAHMDTVGVEGMKIPPFQPDIKDGCLYGRGSCDTKASLAAMLVACQRIIQEGIDTDLIFMACASEESGCQGSRVVELGKYNCGGFIVGEPTSCCPVVGHKMHATVEFICRGKSSHGSRPECGENAITRAGSFLEFLQKEIVPYYNSIQNPLYERGCTFSPTMINGGTKSNIIPDACSITCDMRLLPEAGSFEDNIKMISDKAQAALGFPIEIGYAYAAFSLKSSLEGRFVSSVCSAVSACGGDATPLTVAYGTDAGCLSNKGYDCVVLGPGDIKLAHSAVEYVPLAEVHKAVEIYTEAARQYAGKMNNG